MRIVAGVVILAAVVSIGAAGDRKPAPAIAWVSMQQVLAQSDEAKAANAKLEDLTSIPQGPTGLEAWPDILVRLTRAPFVSMALIRGRATGNGSEIALACDMSFASREKSVFSQWEVGVGLVAGGGPDEGRYKNMTADLGISASVFFTGYLSPQQVAACLRMADAALVFYRDTPVNRHRASMKLREALASGVKVVATEVGEAAQFDKVIFGAKPTAEAFAEAIEKALKSRQNPAGASKLVRHLDWKTCVENLETAITRP